ncbi:Transcription factor [Umbelopsis nana]
MTNTSQICTAYNTTIKRRNRLKPEETEYLADKFQSNPKPTRKKIQEIAADMNINERTVQIWFQNKRAKLRRLQKEMIGSEKLFPQQQTGKTLSKNSSERASRSGVAGNTFSLASHESPERIMLHTFSQSTGSLPGTGNAPSAQHMDESQRMVAFWPKATIVDIPLQSYYSSSTEEHCNSVPSNSYHL